MGKLNLENISLSELKNAAELKTGIEELLTKKHRSFFFDTANASYIREAWKKLSVEFSSNNIAGITTNPSAFDKIDARDFDSWKRITGELCALLTEIKPRSLGAIPGIVYVQFPVSTLSVTDLLQWVDEVSTWGDGTSVVGVKIPPYTNILKAAAQIKMKRSTPLNVTGVSDCSTALMSFGYGMDHVSMIPGRMEEKGIDAKSHLAYVQNRGSGNGKMITGSMRTMEGLKWVCEYGTVPTIGTRVFDEILSSPENIKAFGSFWDDAPLHDHLFSPLVTDTERTLSVDFFTQMDAFGKNVANQFFSTKK